MMMACACFWAKLATAENRSPSADGTGDVPAAAKQLVTDYRLDFAIDRPWNGRSGGVQLPTVTAAESAEAGRADQPSLDVRLPATERLTYLQWKFPVREEVAQRPTGSTSAVATPARSPQAKPQPSGDVGPTVVGPSIVARILSGPIQLNSDPQPHADSDPSGQQTPPPSPKTRRTTIAASEPPSSAVSPSTRPSEPGPVSTMATPNAVTHAPSPYPTGPPAQGPQSQKIRKTMVAGSKSPSSTVSSPLRQSSPQAVSTVATTNDSTRTTSSSPSDTQARASQSHDIAETKVAVSASSSAAMPTSTRRAELQVASTSRTANASTRTWPLSKSDQEAGPQTHTSRTRNVANWEARSEPKRLPIPRLVTTSAVSAETQRERATTSNVDTIGEPKETTAVSRSNFHAPIRGSHQPQLKQETVRHIAGGPRAGHSAGGTRRDLRSEIEGHRRHASHSADAGCQTEGQLHSMALAEGLRALEEADDFHFQGMQYEADLRIENFIAGHRTPALKGKRQLSPVKARESYYEFAVDRLVAAGGTEEVAARRTVRPGAFGTDDSPVRRRGRRRMDRAEIALFQASLAINPDNAVAANELGVALARDGQSGKSSQYFAQSAQLAPSARTLANLSKVFERLGEHESAVRLRQQMAALSTDEPSQSSIRLVSLDDFTAGEEFDQGPQPVPKEKEETSVAKQLNEASSHGPNKFQFGESSKFPD